MLSIKKLAVFGFLLCVLLFNLSVKAQTASASLSILVTDEQNANVPNSIIKIKNEQTAFERTATATEAGSFVFSKLPASVRNRPC